MLNIIAREPKMDPERKPYQEASLVIVAYRRAPADNEPQSAEWTPAYDQSAVQGNFLEEMFYRDGMLYPNTPEHNTIVPLRHGDEFTIKVDDRELSFRMFMSPSGINLNPVNLDLRNQLVFVREPGSDGTRYDFLVAFRNGPEHSNPLYFWDASTSHSCLRPRVDLTGFSQPVDSLPVRSTVITPKVIDGETMTHIGISEIKDQIGNLRGWFSDVGRYPDGVLSLPILAYSGNETRDFLILLHVDRTVRPLGLRVEDQGPEWRITIFSEEPKDETAAHSVKIGVASKDDCRYPPFDVDVVGAKLGIAPRLYYDLERNMLQVNQQGFTSNWALFLDKVEGLAKQYGVEMLEGFDDSIHLIATEIVKGK